MRFFLCSRFFIPGRRLSRPSFKRFISQIANGQSVRSAIDDLVERVCAEDFTVALSTAYEWIYQSVRALRLNAGRLAIRVGGDTGVGTLRSASKSAVGDLFSPKIMWHPAHHMLVYPP